MTYINKSTVEKYPSSMLIPLLQFKNPLKNGQTQQELDYVYHDHQIFASAWANREINRA